MRTQNLTRRTLLVVSIAVVLGLLLGACSAPAAPPPAPAPTSAPAATTAPEPTKAPPPTAAPAPTKAPEGTKAPEPTKPPAPTATAEPKKVEGHVVVMTNRGELSDDQIKQFEADNPGITIEFVPYDNTRFMAMYAAGNPPDIVRVQAPMVPSLLARNMLLDLTPYFQSSSLIKIDDLADANKYYWAESPLEIGTGKMYGMVKDFSPDFTLFANSKAFEAAGVPVPDPSKVLTYAEVADLAGKVSKINGDRIEMFGYGLADSWIDRIWMNALAEKGQSLYTPQFDKIILDTDDAKALVKYYVDLAEKRLVASPTDPSPNGWSGADFAAGMVGLTQWGYWFQAMAESDATKGSVVMLPAPTWGTERRDPTMTATGWVVTSQTKVPDAAWKVFEWYMAGQPAIDRAKSGWGVPALKSQVNLLPQETPFQQEAYKILQGELALGTPPLQFNPFIGENVVSNAYNKYLDQYLKKEIKFDDLIKGIEADVNQAIKDGIAATIR
jgi:multiple sugar transport system substrate-binding protein